MELKARIIAVLSANITDAPRIHYMELKECSGSRTIDMTTRYFGNPLHGVESKIKNIGDTPFYLNRIHYMELKDLKPLLYHNTPTG